ncbi:MAG: hypothetical protein KC586_26710 [Myxococcales bacterium]|nr:hypothetical protein [Myxococcales bacterium]
MSRRRPRATWAEPVLGFALVRARFRRFRLRVGLEASLALFSAALVLVVLSTKPYGVPGQFSAFAMALGVAMMLPRLARSSSRGVAEVFFERGELRVRGKLGPRSLGRPTAVDVVAGKRGASLLVSMADGALVGLEVDDAAEAHGFAETLRGGGPKAPVRLPRAKWSRTLVALRTLGVLSALGYYLHQVAHVIGGHKAIYGIAGIVFGALALVLHLARHRDATLLRDGTLATRGGTRGLRGGAKVRAARGDVVVEPPTGAEERLQLGELPAGFRAQVAAHLRAAAHPLPPPRAPEDVSFVDALARSREEVGEDEGYRSARAGALARLRARVEDRDAPLASRAAAMRALVRVEPVEPSPEDPDRGFLLEVAASSSDAEASARVAARLPCFESE